MLQSSYQEKVLQLHEPVTFSQEQKTSLWLEHVLFTTYWWVGLLLSIVPWIVWVLLSKKASRNRLFYTGLLVAVISSYLDFLGTQFGLWIYYYEVLPWLPAFIPWDWTLIPISIISLIEYKPNLSPLLKGIIFAVLSSFIGGSIFTYFNFYELLKWEHYYSFPIYLLIYLLAHWHSRRDQFAPFW
ncbi:CBO0543 family protein [Virgibacillus kekensis]|uniref:CBO0543 family protein n=1 Tax=Virgibacillus kekensis TaxID=202261 RepID=A0ABV9DN78_9BACI